MDGNNTLGRHSKTRNITNDCQLTKWGKSLLEGVASLKKVKMDEDITSQASDLTGLCMKRAANGECCPSNVKVEHENAVDFESVTRAKIGSGDGDQTKIKTEYDIASFTVIKVEDEITIDQVGIKTEYGNTNDRRPKETKVEDGINSKNSDQNCVNSYPFMVREPDVWTENKMECNGGTSVGPSDKLADKPKRADSMGASMKNVNDEAINVPEHARASLHLSQRTQTPSRNTYNCNICSYTCKFKSKLTSHMRSHTGEKPFSCSYCDYKSSRGSDLTVHTRIHTGEKPFSCESCDYRSNNAGTLRKHVKTHSGDKPFSCFSCDYRCRKASQLKVHVRTHTGEKPYSCGSCEYNCSSAPRLKRHMRTHTGEKPFSCSYCDYLCSEAADLKVHVRIHTGEKPFFCDSCDYRSTRADKLKLHKRTHTGEKPFSCDCCDYRCSRGSCLTRHIRVHTGEKPFSCDSCDYRCTRADKLKEHMSTHTGGNPFSGDSWKRRRSSHLRNLYNCYTCNYGCKFKRSLIIHMRTHLEG